MMPGPGITVHATAVLVGPAAVLIRGAPGSGKSSLARALIDRADARLCARLIADDAVVLHACGGRLVATAPRPIAGLMETRCIGLVETQWEPRGLVRLVIDLVCEGAAERLPEEGRATETLLGVAMPRIELPAGLPDAASCVTLALDLVRARKPLPAIPLRELRARPIRA